MDENNLGSIMLRLAELNIQDMKRLGLPQDTETYLEQIGKISNKSGMIKTIENIQLELNFKHAQSERKPLQEADLKLTKENDTIKAEDKVKYEYIPNYLKVIDGKVGGKVPLQDYYSIRMFSIKNPNCDSMCSGTLKTDLIVI